MQEIITLILKIIVSIFALFGIKEVGSKIFFNVKGKTSILDSRNISETIHGNKSVTNNIYLQGSSLGSASDLLGDSNTKVEYRIPDFYKEGLDKINFSNESIEYLGVMFNYIFKAKKSSRNGMTMLKGAVTAIGFKDYNLEWREHAAGSLRELLDEFESDSKISEAFSNAFTAKNPEFPSYKKNDEIRPTYLRFKNFYNYFSEIHHHNSQFIIHRLQSLYGDEKKAGDDTPNMFIEVTEDYLNELESFFKQYVKKL